MDSVGQCSHLAVPLRSEPRVFLGPIHSLIAWLRSLILLHRRLVSLLYRLGLGSRLKNTLVLFSLPKLRLGVKEFFLSLNDLLGITGFVSVLVQVLGLIKGEIGTGFDLGDECAFSALK
jgi:hypothetical protein